MSVNAEEELNNLFEFLNESGIKASFEEWGGSDALRLVMNSGNSSDPYERVWTRWANREALIKTLDKLGVRYQAAVSSTDGPILRIDSSMLREVQKTIRKKVMKLGKDVKIDDEFKKTFKSSLEANLNNSELLGKKKNYQETAKQQVEELWNIQFYAPDPDLLALRQERLKKLEQECKNLIANDPILRPFISLVNNDEQNDSFRIKLNFDQNKNDIFENAKGRLLNEVFLKTLEKLNIRYDKTENDGFVNINLKNSNAIAEMSKVFKEELDKAVEKFPDFDLMNWSPEAFRVVHKGFISQEEYDEFESSEEPKPIPISTGGVLSQREYEEFENLLEPAPEPIKPPPKPIEPAPKPILTDFKSRTTRLPKTVTFAEGTKLEDGSKKNVKPKKG